jgi:hypothetical protein
MSVLQDTYTYIGVPETKQRPYSQKAARDLLQIVKTAFSFRRRLENQEPTRVVVKRGDIRKNTYVGVIGGCISDPDSQEFKALSADQQKEFYVLYFERRPESGVWERTGYVLRPERTDAINSFFNLPRGEEQKDCNLSIQICGALCDADFVAVYAMKHIQVGKDIKFFFPGHPYGERPHSSMRIVDDSGEGSDVAAKKAARKSPAKARVSAGAAPDSDSSPEKTPRDSAMQGSSGAEDDELDDSFSSDAEFVGNIPLPVIFQIYDNISGLSTRELHRVQTDVDLYRFIKEVSANGRRSYDIKDDTFATTSDVAKGTPLLTLGGLQLIPDVNNFFGNPDQVFLVHDKRNVGVIPNSEDAGGWTCIREATEEQPANLEVDLRVFGKLPMVYLKASEQLPQGTELIRPRFETVSKARLQFFHFIDRLTGFTAKQIDEQLYWRKFYSVGQHRQEYLLFDNGVWRARTAVPAMKFVFALKGSYDAATGFLQDGRSKYSVGSLTVTANKDEENVDVFAMCPDLRGLELWAVSTTKGIPADKPLCIAQESWDAFKAKLSGIQGSDDEAEGWDMDSAAGDVESEEGKSEDQAAEGGAKEKGGAEDSSCLNSEAGSLSVSVERISVHDSPPGTPMRPSMFASLASPIPSAAIASHQSPPKDDLSPGQGRATKRLCTQPSRPHGVLAAACEIYSGVITVSGYSRHEATALRASKELNKIVREALQTFDKCLQRDEYGGLCVSAKIKEGTILGIVPGCYISDLKQQSAANFTANEQRALQRVPYGRQEYAGFIPSLESAYSIDMCDSSEMLTACNAKVSKLPFRSNVAAEFRVLGLIATCEMEVGTTLTVYTNPDNQVFDADGRSMLVNEAGDRVQGTSYFKQ